MLKLIHIPGRTPPDHVPALLVQARERGFDGSEIVIGEGRTCDLLADEASVHALREASESSGVRIASLLLAENGEAAISHSSEEVRLAERARVRAAAEIAARLSAEVLRIVPAAPPAAPEARPWSYQDALNETYHSLRILAGDFETAGLAGAIEVCRHRFLLSPPETRELLDRVNSPWVGACLDWAACEVYGYPRDWAETLGYRLRAAIVEPGTEDAAWTTLAQAGFEGAVVVPGPSG